MFGILPTVPVIPVFFWTICTFRVMESFNPAGVHANTVVVPNQNQVELFLFKFIFLNKVLISQALMRSSNETEETKRSGPDMAVFLCR